jgi:hypothetical protein
MLGLTAGGTDFCQALTVIIDDIDGRLPLDPTKQGVAFGHHANGHVHHHNLYSVISGVVKFYYRYHRNKFGGSKSILTAKILEFSSADLPDELKTCRKSILTDYGVHFNITKDNRIIVDHTFQVGTEIGPDTIFRLLPPDPQNGGCKGRKGKTPVDGASKSARSPAKKRPTLSKKQSIAKVKPLFSKKKKMASKEPKKCQRATEKAKDSPPQLKGTRSSTRQRRRPAYLDAESADYGDSEIESEESVDAKSAKHGPPRRKGRRSSIKKSRRESNGYVRDGENGLGNGQIDDMEAETIQEVIDICSSSDEEDGLMSKDVPIPDCVSSCVCNNESAEMPADVASVNFSNENHVAEELKSDEENDATNIPHLVAKSLEIENLNAKVLSLQKENELLQNELTDLRHELEQSKLATTAMERRLHVYTSQ